MNKKHKYNIVISNFTALLLLSAFLNLTASVFFVNWPTGRIADKNGSIYESESPVNCSAASSRMEKRGGISSGLSPLILIIKKTASLNKIKLQFKSFQPEDYLKILERNFLISQYSTDT